MSKLIKSLVGVAVAAAGVYVVGKYLHDYTDYKAASQDDLDGIRQGGSNMKDAAKRTYAAIRDKGDVKTPVSDMGHAIGEIASGTGKLIGTVGSNTVQFVKDEKQRYKEDPTAFRQEVKDNIKDMGHQAKAVFTNLKDSAVDLAGDIKEKAENLTKKSDNTPEYCAIPMEESLVDAEAKAEFIVEEKAAEVEKEVKEAKEFDNIGVVISEDTEKLN